MKRHLEIEAFLAAAVIGIPLPALAQAQAAADPAATISAEQKEADYRVIAARCGTPAFEKSFYRQSRAAVAAGLVNKKREPAEVEKTITALRRSPFVLVTATADCPAELRQLAEVQKARSVLVKSNAGRKAQPR